MYVRIQRWTLWKNLSEVSLAVGNQPFVLIAKVGFIFT